MAVDRSGSGYEVGPGCVSIWKDVLRRHGSKWRKSYGGPRPPDPELHVPRDYYKQDNPRVHKKVTALLSKALDDGCEDNNVRSAFRTMMGLKNIIAEQSSASESDDDNEYGFISVNWCQPQVEVKVLVVIGSHGPLSNLHKFTPTSDGTSQTLSDV